MTKSLSYRHKIIKHPTPKTQSLSAYGNVHAPEDTWGPLALDAAGGGTSTVISC